RKDHPRDPRGRGDRLAVPGQAPPSGAGPPAGERGERPDHHATGPYDPELEPSGAGNRRSLSARQVQQRDGGSSQSLQRYDQSSPPAHLPQDWRFQSARSRRLFPHRAARELTTFSATTTFPSRSKTRAFDLIHPRIAEAFSCTVTLPFRCSSDTSPRKQPFFYLI